MERRKGAEKEKRKGIDDSGGESRVRAKREKKKVKGTSRAVADSILEGLKSIQTRLQDIVLSSSPSSVGSLPPDFRRPQQVLKSSSQRNCCRI
jgi:hypothetical protein